MAQSAPGSRLAQFLSEREIDHPDVTEAARRWGDDPDLVWQHLDDGSDLLWFAGVVGVPPSVVAGVALQALDEAYDRLGEDDHHFQVFQVLDRAEAVLAGTAPPKELEEAGWDAYDRMVYANSGPPLSDDADTVMDAAVYAARAALWVLHATGADAHDDCSSYECAGGLGDAAMVLYRLAGSSLLPAEGEGDATEPPSAFWARFVRDRIDAAVVAAAARHIIDEGT